MSGKDKKEKAPREYRGVIDEIRQQQMKMKDMSFKGKLAYFWDYYKIHTLVAVIVIIMSITLIHDIVSSKDYNFYAVMLNCRVPSDNLEAVFSEYAQLDSETYDCFIDTNSTLSYTNINEYDMATTQRLLALVQTGDLDAVVFDSTTFKTYALNSMFHNLRDIMSAEELSQYEDRLYYIDYAQVIAEEEDDSVDMEEVNARSTATTEDIIAEAETHRHPETMEEPVPVGIFMADCPFVTQTGLYSDTAPIYGAVITSQRLETALSYLSFLWEEKYDFLAILTQ